ncbi:hypothetical protein [Falsiroseomonas sp.]|uniref:hypothetical protein n=1 Tax=unclassified Falsiroseomonas TaxID=2870720 RepID=UPI002718FA9A|nr:hypothetical protein [Falsiroseomonas sp.]MDO9501407.1 hypothetical protein [Falsiroseomonas sp.]
MEGLLGVLGVVRRNLRVDLHSADEVDDCVAGIVGPKISMALPMIMELVIQRLPFAPGMWAILVPRLIMAVLVHGALPS